MVHFPCSRWSCLWTNGVASSSKALVEYEMLVTTSQTTFLNTTETKNGTNLFIQVLFAC